MTENKVRKEKKSESLDVRLPYSVKTAFMSATKRRGETASEAVRRFIESYIEEAELETVTPLWRETATTVRKNPLKSLAAASAVASAMTMTALPAAAVEAGYNTSREIVKPTSSSEEKDAALNGEDDSDNAE